MNRPLLTFLLLFSCLTAAAQTVVRGVVQNAKSKENVGFAIVALLKDTGIVKSTQADADGVFRLAVPAAGKYKLRASSIGLDTKLIDLTLTAASDTLTLDTLRLNARDNVLGTAVVSTTLAKVEQKTDTTVFNAGAYRVPEGSTLEALIKQLPGVQVSDDGTITWNGKTVSEFLINGKDFFKGDTKVAMKNLPTELVNKVKAYDKKSDYTEQTGIDDGEETTVLDISTKRALNESWVSNVDLGIGTEKRYANKIFISRFDDQSNISVYGSANNTNDRGFGGPQGFGGGSGLTASKSAGASFNWDNGKPKRWSAGRVEVGGDIRFSHSSTDSRSITSSETFLTDTTSTFGESDALSKGSSTSFYANARLRWNPDSLTSIMFRPSFSYSESRSSGLSAAATFNSDPYFDGEIASPLDSMFASAINAQLLGIAVNTKRSQTLGSSRSNSLSAMLNITRRFGATGRNLNLTFNAGYGKSTSKSYALSDIRYYQNSSKTGTFQNQYTLTPAKNYNYSARLGYVEPLGNNWFAEARYEYSYRYTDNRRSRYDLENLSGFDSLSYANGTIYPLGTLPTDAALLQSVLDEENSQYATYRYTTQRVNLGVRYVTKTIRLSAGISLEPQHTTMEYTRPAVIDTTVTRNVFNLSPQVRFRYKISDTDRLDFTYRGSASQPSMTQLLDVWDDSDPLNVSGGNPGLKPSWTNTVEANYNAYNADRQQGIGVRLNVKQTSNAISSRMVYNSTTGVTYTRPDNINGNWSATGNFMFNTGLGVDKTYTLSTFTNLSYDNAVGYISTTNYTSSAAAFQKFLSTARTVSATSYAALYESAANASSKSTTRTLGVSENITAAYRGSWFDVSLIGSLDYKHARSTLQSSANMDTWQFAYGASANFSLPWGTSVSTDIRMNSRRGYAVSAMNTNELVWNAQLSHSFLSNKAATVSLQFYDILRRQSTVSRQISATMRSDSWTNAINSYVMLHFIYKLNLFGNTKKKSGDDDGDRPRNFGGDRPQGPPTGGGGGFGGRGGFGGGF